MKILIACEFSGVVRDAFIKQGHDAVSCDMLPTESPGPHYKGDVLDILHRGWDVMIAHPPCTDLAVSGARWFPEKIKDGRQQRSIEFFMLLSGYKKIPVKAIENPVSIMSTLWRKPDQYVQPFQFGHPETKKTCLWLEELPPLEPTNVVTPEFIITKDGKRYSPVHYLSNNSKNDRGRIRSITYQGIADAMAEQWSTHWLLGG